MAANKLILGTSSIKTSLVSDSLCSVSTFENRIGLKQHTKASALASPKITTLQYNTKGPSLSSIPPLLRPCNPRLQCWALRASSDGNDGIIPALLDRPAYVPKQRSPEEVGSLSDLFLDDDDDEQDGVEHNFDNWVDWEDEILKETQPLIRFVKMILHSQRYRSGERLSREDEKIILKKLLPYHPELEEKIGCGVDFIMVDYHPDFFSTRCLFITRKDGQSIDFSFWKCLRGLVWKKYPLYAESFIEKHMRPRSS